MDGVTVGEGDGEVLGRAKLRLSRHVQRDHARSGGPPPVAIRVGAARAGPSSLSH